MTPYFSVIVPVYKAEAYLPQCVDSILGQRFADLELILVDDGSPDGSGALCDAYAAADRRVRALHQPNAGPTPARRRGLAMARGEYICFVDADDWVVPHWLETVKGLIDQNGQPDMVLYDITRDTGPSLYPLFAEEGYYDKARLEQEIYPWMLCDVRKRPFGTQFFPGFLVTKVCRSELIKAHFLADERISIFEDAAMSYDCLWHARSLYVLRQPLYVYRRTEQSNLKRHRPDFFQQLKMVQDYMTATLGGKAPEIDRQISGFVINETIFGIIGEYYYQARVFSTVRTLDWYIRQSGIMKAVSAKGLPLFVRLYIWAFKCHLSYPAVLLTVLSVRPKPKKAEKGD